MTREPWFLTEVAGYIDSHIADEFIDATKFVITYRNFAFDTFFLIPFVFLCLVSLFVFHVLIENEIHYSIEGLS